MINSSFEAQDLVDELKQLQPDPTRDTLFLEVEVNRARNRLDKALDLIQNLLPNDQTLCRSHDQKPRRLG